MDALAIALAAAVLVLAWERAMLTEALTIRVALRRAARRYGLVPEYLEAIAWVESGWRLAAVNLSGTDGARGGAWGPTQITERTVRALGYAGPMRGFNLDAELAAEWTGRILADAHWRRPLATLADYCAAWNAGKDDADRNNDGDLEELGATHVTRAKYLPAAQRALAAVYGAPVPEGGA